MTPEFQSLHTWCEKHNFKVSQDEIQQILFFLDMVEDASHRLNLTRISREDALELHAFDSLTLLPYLPNEAQRKILDLGTGAGFPGIPLAIVRPDLEFVLVDARQKKLEFLEYAVEKLGLENVQCVHGRAEDLGRETNLREKFHGVSARAFALLPLLLELTSPFVQPGGQVLAMKGQKVDEELVLAKPQLEEFSLQLTQDYAFELPQSKAQRRILVFDKTVKISEKYPRSAKVLAKLR